MTSYDIMQMSINGSIKTNNDYIKNKKYYIRLSRWR